MNTKQDLSKFQGVLEILREEAGLRPVFQFQNDMRRIMRLFAALGLKDDEAKAREALLECCRTLEPVMARLAYVKLDIEEAIRAQQQK